LLLFLPDYHQTQSLYLPSGRNRKDAGRKNANTAPISNAGESYSCFENIPEA
jgi:hypothetical protein